jgi:hypothetical protein
VLAAALLVAGAALLADASPLAAVDAPAPVSVAGAASPQAAMSESMINNTSADDTERLCPICILPPTLPFNLLRLSFTKADYVCCTS